MLNKHVLIGCLWQGECTRAAYMQRTIYLLFTTT